MLKQAKNICNVNFKKAYFDQHNEIGRITLPHAERKKNS